jgi:DNA-binding transcriptional ArsR family regulator
VNDRRPEPGSPWACHCPDAWPREWLDRSGVLPPGFARAATPREADLITGRVTEAAFLHANGRGTPPAPSRRRKGKRNPVVRKLLGYRQFLDALPDLDPRLSHGAVALWCWLWTCEQKGRARSTARRIGDRFGVAKSTASRWLAELTAAGFVKVIRRGQAGRSASVVRVRPRVRVGGREKDSAI